MIERSKPRLEAFYRHLKGVRGRLAWVLLAFGVGASLTWYFHKAVMLWLIAPARGHLSASGLPVYTNPTDMFGLAVNLAIYGGEVVAAPVLVFHVFRFISPILSKKLRRFLAIFLPMCLVFFLCGAAFSYYVLLPTGLKFLLSFGDGVAAPMVQITDYMTLALAMILWLGVIFELPLVMFLLSKMRLVPFRWFQKVHRYVPVAAFILSAIITPTFDAVNQTLLAVPMILLFELGLALAWVAQPKQPKQRQRAGSQKP